MDHSSVSLRTFAHAFFSHFGAQLFPADDDLLVILPPELTDLFGKPRLYLTFADETVGQQQQLSAEEDLLSFGSRTFDRMLDILAQRGQAAVFQLSADLPTNFPLDLPFLSPRQTANLNLTHSEQLSRPIYLFHFRITCSWIEKTETFLTIALDQTGTPQPQAIPLLNTNQPFAAPATPFSMDEVLLQTLYNQAVQIAQTTANAQVQSKLTTVETTLNDNISRLYTFYQQWEAEMSKPDQAAKDALQRDFAAQVAAEQQRCRLEVTIQPLGYAIMIVPLADYFFTLTVGDKTGLLKVSQNLHTRQIDSYTCQTCGSSLLEAAKPPSLRPRAPQSCLLTCPLRQQSVVQSCIAAISSPLPNSRIPATVHRYPQQFNWRHLITNAGTIYVGQPLATTVFPSWLRRRVMVTVEATDKVIYRHSVSVWDRLKVFG